MCIGFNMHTHFYKKETQLSGIRNVASEFVLMDSETADHRLKSPLMTGCDMVLYILLHFLCVSFLKIKACVLFFKKREREIKL